MKKNVASQKIGAQMITASDGSAFTGSVTVYVTGDAGTQAVGSVGSGACTHEGNGYHTYAPAQAETNYDLVAFTFIGTGAIPATVQTFTNYPQTGDNYTRLGAPAGASVSADIAALPTAAENRAEIDSNSTKLAAIVADTNELQTDDVPGLIAALNDPTAAAIADAVWDEATSGHTTTGTTGKALSDAGSAGDPWSTSLPGAYGAGTAGKIVGDNLDATVSSRLASSSYTAPDNATIAAIAGYVDTEVAAIKAVTDNLPDSGALSTITTHLTDIKGGTFSGATDSLEALRNRGDAAWVTASGFSTHSAADVWSVGTRVLTASTNLNDLDAAGIRAAVGLASANLDTQIGTIDTNVDAIKAKTDSLTYTVTGQVDANIQYVNDTAVTGNGGSGTEWGPA